MEEVEKMGESGRSEEKRRKGEKCGNDAHL